MVKITAIAAIDDKRGIATSNGIPWDIFQDRRYFKRKTLNSTVVMGSNTYRSIGRPLPNRINIVLTRSLKNFEGCRVAHSVDESLKLAGSEIMVIGGQEIYTQFLPISRLLLITRVRGDFSCTKFFPDYRDQFRIVYKSRTYNNNGLVFWYEHWQRLG